MMRMDSITQGLLGAVTAQLGFRGKLGAKAPWIAAATAMVPDLDSSIVSALRLVGLATGPFAHLRHHRGLSHGILGVVVLGAIAGAVWAAFRRRDYRWIFGCTIVAALSHPLLDVCTSYGTQLLSPFSDRRLALHVVPIVDLIYTGLLVGTLIACGLARWLAARGGHTALAAAWIGFGLSVGYLAGGRAMHDRAVRLGRAAFAEAGMEPSAEVEAYPTLGGIFRWRIVGRDGPTWYVAGTNLLFDRPLEVSAYDDDDGPLVDRAQANGDVETFAWFAAGQLRAVQGSVDGRTVIDLHDMRYGRTDDSGLSRWAVRVVFDGNGRVAEVVRVYAGGGGPRRSGPMLWSMAPEAWRGMFQP